MRPRVRRWPHLATTFLLLPRTQICSCNPAKKDDFPTCLLTTRCHWGSHTAEPKWIHKRGAGHRMRFKAWFSFISMFMHAFLRSNFLISNWWKILSIETGLRLAALALDQLSPNWDLAVVQVSSDLFRQAVWGQGG